MAENEPTTEQPFRAGDTTPWADERERLADADTYWLATVRADGLPHWSIDFWVYDVGATADKAAKPGGRKVTPPLRNFGGRDRQNGGPPRAPSSP